MNFIKHSFAALKDGGSLNVTLESADKAEVDQVKSYLKMMGFQNSDVYIQEGVIKISGTKPNLTANTESGGPPKIRRKNKNNQIEQKVNGVTPAAANPWAALQDAPAQVIDEDKLMK